MAAPVFSRRILSLASVVAIVAFPTAALAHGGDENKIPEGKTISDDPIDATLWVHIVLMMLAFGVIFPVGMVLGITKNRWHVPTQILGTVIAILAWFLGHAHKGRQFVSHNVHAVFANILTLLLVVQVVFGGYLKLHLENGFHGRVRRVVRPIHSVLGKAMPVLSWTQIVFGVITALGFCQDDHLGQCAAHFIMGSAFIAYGILLTLVLLVGQLWLRRTGRSQEFFDSVVIAAWGCVNTFTEHRWGTPWVKNDWQHTTMGIIWWCAGLAGMWLSRDRDGNPKRNFIPGFVIAVTGWGMSAHPQDLPVSAMTHAMFGKTLMATGIARIIEISFVLKDRGSLSDDGRQYNSWQLIPVFLLYAAGLLFMGATEEQMDLVANSSMDHISYILILYSLAFLMFLFVNMLIGLYDYTNKEGKVALPNGAAPELNGHHRSVSETRRLRDAEEFELEGLISDDEDERKKARRGADEEDSLDSPTVGAAGVSGGRVAL